MLKIYGCKYFLEGWIQYSYALNFIALLPLSIPDVN